MLESIKAISPEIIAVYVYGSHIYGTANENSDRDFIVILRDGQKIDENIIESFKSQRIDLNVFNQSEFIQMIKEHEISALECLFIPKESKVEDEDFLSHFNLDKAKLRSAFSAKSSNSWVKAKKKFLVEKDYDPLIGKKSLWHSFRIMDFGTQIATTGKINDFATLNLLLKDIMLLNDWSSLEEKYKKPYNEICSKFKAVAPKEVNAVVTQKVKI